MIEIRYIFDWNNKPVNEYTIKNGQYQFSAINIGAAITKIIVPNKQEKLENISLRYYDYKLYKNNRFLLGSLIDYTKFTQNIPCQLNEYFDCILEQNTLTFTYSQEGQWIKAKYSLLNNHLLIEYDTNTDVILSNAIYFNLSGNHKRDVKTHHVKIGKEEIELNQEMDQFKQYEVKHDQELVLIKLKENGIKVTLDSIERDVNISNGSTFNKAFYINKEVLAERYSGIGVVVGGRKLNNYINYQFN